MDDTGDNDEQLQKVAIHRPFHPKFMRELNGQHAEKPRKNKKKTREPHTLSAHKLSKFEAMGIPTTMKSLKKLPETNRNGNKIFAHWKNNQIHGQAEVYYSNGVVFKGLYQLGIKTKGYFKFLQGFEYIGHCVGNRFDGEGALFYPSGKIISGEWKDYDIVGKGKIEYPNGEVYYGQIKDLKKHGKGYLFFNDGSKYIGEFKEGQIYGYGSYFINDEPVETGVWVNGELQSTVELDELLEEEHNFEMRELAGMMRSTKVIGEPRGQKVGKQNKVRSGYEQQFASSLSLNIPSLGCSLKKLNGSSKNIGKKLRFQDKEEFSDKIIDI